MKVLAHQDFLEVRLASMIADYDRDTLSNLYQPMIGFEALSLYMTLWSEANNERVSPLCTHEQVFLRMRMPASAFVDARKYLEATGLLRTFVSEGNDYKIYHYELYAPKSPSGFFDDALLYGMLIRSIGENNANRLKKIYVLDAKQDYGREITSSFMDVFNPELNDKSFIEATENKVAVKGRNRGKILGEFSYEIFFKELAKVSQLTDKAFSKEEMKEVERIATLNGIDEREASKLVDKYFDINAVKGKRIDFEKLKGEMKFSQSKKRFREFEELPFYTPNKNKGNTDLAKKVNDMERIPPKYYLSIKQNYTKPAAADLKLIDDLSANYNLPPSVINVIVDYVLVKADNVLSRAYAEKVAVSLVRENIRTAVDAMNYLKNIEKKQKGTKNTKFVIKANLKDKKIDPEQSDVIKSESNKEDDDWESDWDRIMDELNGGDKGGKA